MIIFDLFCFLSVIAIFCFRRTKQNVIQELWQHYETFHSQAILDGTAAAPTVNMCLPAATAQAVTIPPVTTHPTAGLTMSEQTYVAKFCNPDPLYSSSALSLPLDVPAAARATTKTAAWVGHVADEDEENISLS